MNCNIYNLGMNIKLSSGETIKMQNIELMHTYAGLMCGAPDRLINNQMISEIKEREICLFVIEPQITITDENTFFGRKERESKYNEEVQFMPPIMLKADFECCENNDCTKLTIVWFQNQFSLVLPEHIEKAIQNIDWHKHACRFML